MEMEAGGGHRLVVEMPMGIGGWLSICQRWWFHGHRGLVLRKGRRRLAWQMGRLRFRSSCLTVVRRKHPRLASRYRWKLLGRTGMRLARRRRWCRRR